MELQEFAFLGRVRQFLRQRSCLGANISLYCPASEGSQESRKEGGRCSRIFLPSTPKRTGASKHTGGGWEVVPGPGRCRGTGRRQTGSLTGQGCEVRWRHEFVFGFSPAQRMRLYLSQGTPGDAHHSHAGQALQPVLVSFFYELQTPDLTSQLSLSLPEAAAG